MNTLAIVCGAVYAFLKAKKGTVNIQKRRKSCGIHRRDNTRENPEQKGEEDSEREGFNEA